jgi:hypothetical protein
MKRKPLLTTGIIALSLTILIWLLVWRMHYVEPLNSEFPMELLYLVPLAGFMHIFAIVALCVPRAANRWLAVAALLLFWTGWRWWVM